MFKKFGEDNARLYAEANQTAIEQVLSFALNNNINCDIQRVPSYTYAVDDESREQVKEEVEAAQKLGLPASFTEDVLASIQNTWSSEI